MPAGAIVLLSMVVDSVVVVALSVFVPPLPQDARQAAAAKRRIAFFMIVICWFGLSKVVVALLQRLSLIGRKFSQKYNALAVSLIS